MTDDTARTTLLASEAHARETTLRAQLRRIADGPGTVIERVAAMVGDRVTAEEIISAVQSRLLAASIALRLQLNMHLTDQWVRIIGIEVLREFNAALDASAYPEDVAPLGKEPEAVPMREVLGDPAGSFLTATPWRIRGGPSWEEHEAALARIEALEVAVARLGTMRAASPANQRRSAGT